MKHAATTMLVRAHFQKSHLRHFLAPAFFLLSMLVSVLWTLLHIESDSEPLLFVDFAYGVFSLLSAAWAFRVIYKSRIKPFHSELLRRVNTQLTDILDLEALQTCIVETTTQQLGYDAAILLLLEDWAIETHSPFRVHASSTIGKMRQWRFQGNRFLSHLLKNGQLAEVRWERLTSETPAEIYKWSKEEHIPVTHFFSLIYQGHTLGCLGISTRRRMLRPQDIVTVQAFAEQVAALIEHALLYKEAREHEAFARAMANIATRLNAAVVEPGEIYELICSEGANALQADFTVLYVPAESEEQDQHGKLLPLAAFETDSIAPASDWPVIRAHHSPMNAFHSLQPVLVPITSSSTSPLSTEDQRSLTIRDKLLAHSVQTAIYAPLIAAEEPVGMLVFARSVPLDMYDKRSFGNESLAFAQDFAEQAAIALTNANLYQHLRSTHQRLQELDELKDQFMVTASHELRTPLTAVQGYIELLAQFDAMLSAEERHDFLQKAQRSCNELVIMLDNVMDASRIEQETSIREDTLECVNVREMVESVIAILGPQLQQEHRSTLIHIPNTLTVRADPVRLRQVLMNLSLNALKYSPVTSSVIYSARLIENKETSTYSAIISVTDRGKGIAPRDQSRLFQRFLRLESDINSPMRGSGVGLYISRHLVELMRGHIWVESNGIEGEGSTFHIQLPAYTNIESDVVG